MNRQAVLDLLGGEVGARRLSLIERAAGRIETLQFASDTGDAIRARYIPPAGAGPAPAILYCHAHGGRYDIGANELCDGRPALIAPYGAALRDAGFAVLCLEMPCFGARSVMAEDATAKAHLWAGRTLFGRMLAEQVAGLDWLAAQPRVDGARIGAMGISMGGTLAWWLATVEPRIAAAVSICCFADMGALIDTGAHDGHGHYMTVPGLLALGRTGQVAALAAPRPVLHCVGLEDWSTPPDAFARARADAEAGYDGGPVEFHVTPGQGHAETPAMRDAVLSFLLDRLSR